MKDGVEQELRQWQSDFNRAMVLKHGKNLQGILCYVNDHNFDGVRRCTLEAKLIKGR